MRNDYWEACSLYKALLILKVLNKYLKELIIYPTYTNIIHFSPNKQENLHELTRLRSSPEMLS